MRAASPRLTPPPTPMASILIHGSIALLWVLHTLCPRLRPQRPDRLVGRRSLRDLRHGASRLRLLADALPGENHRQTPTRRCLAGHALGVIVAAHNEARQCCRSPWRPLFDQSEPPELKSSSPTMDRRTRLPRCSSGNSGPRRAASWAPWSSAKLHASDVLRWLRLSHHGKPSALNKAMQLVDTEMALTVDADTLLEQNAIAAMRNAFAADPKLVAATGILTPDLRSQLERPLVSVVPDLRIYLPQFSVPLCLDADGQSPVDFGRLRGFPAAGRRRGRRGVRSGVPGRS